MNGKRARVHHSGNETPGNGCEAGTWGIEDFLEIKAVRTGPLVRKGRAAPF